MAIEYTKLMNLAARSSFINIRPIEVQPGWPPEKYIITYTCRGIASIDKKEAPRLTDFHQVSMYMGSEYPLKEPYLKWMTPIWHPNIEHQEPHHVCTNNVQNWFAAKPLAELVLAMGEMVQYKHYHAKWIAPFPLDREAADWVLEFAEPQGILGPGKPLDVRPLLQPQRMRNKSEKPLMSTGEFKKRMTLGRAPVMVRSMSGQIIVGVGDDQAIDVPTAIPGTKPAVAIKFGQRKKEGVPVNTPVPTNSTRPLVPPVQSSGNGTPAPALYSIEIFKDGQLQRAEQIAQPTVSIGRGAPDGSVDLVLAGDPTISRLHVLIERDESGAFWLTVKGQNPVMVAGRVLPRERSIGVEPGQQIEICSYIITLR